MWDAVGGSWRPIHQLRPTPKGPLWQGQGSGWGSLGLPSAVPSWSPGPSLACLSVLILKVWLVDQQYSITFELAGNSESWTLSQTLGIRIFIFTRYLGDQYAR